jgi:hypothetical protein
LRRGKASRGFEGGTCWPARPSRPWVPPVGLRCKGIRSRKAHRELDRSSGLAPLSWSFTPLRARSFPRFDSGWGFWIRTGSANRARGPAESPAIKSSRFCNGRLRSDGSDRILTMGLSTGGYGRLSASRGGVEQFSDSPLRHSVPLSHRDTATLCRSTVGFGP